MDALVVFQNLGIAAGLGLLVGLQRESVASPLAGLRTFTLAALFGSVSAMLAGSFGGWIVAAGALGLAALMVAGNVLMMRDDATDPGLTTEVALLLMFGVGAYVMVGHRGIAIVVGAGTAVLLQAKGELRGIAGRFSQGDVTAIMRFALISLVILPVLPNRTYGPYSVLNPYEIWLMVVLIVGISLGAYVIYKFVGERTGTLAGGILGGLISSTATTVSYARRTREDESHVRSATVVIVIASTVVVVRLLVLMAIVSRTLLMEAAVPAAILLVVMIAMAGFVWWRSADGGGGMPAHENPSELKPAILFGLLYAGVLVAVAAVRENFGGDALYVVAAISGLTDVDAITLTTSRMVSGGRLDADRGWRLVLLANACNLAFKAGSVALLGSRRMAKTIATLFGIGIAVSVILLLAWP